ncbi:MAG: DoxX family protein [Oleispira sp.]
MSITGLARWAQDQLDVTRKVDAIAPLALRLYLFVPFWMAGTNKLAHFEDTAAWFGNADWGLGLPAPMLLAFLATWTEILGAVFLLLGFATRYIAVPLMITMVVAIFTVHWPSGWSAIADGAADAGIAERVNAARSILKEHGNYAWLTEKGNFVILNNGIEFGVTYLIMLLSLFFTGAGKVVSVDYWIAKYFRKGKA